MAISLFKKLEVLVPSIEAAFQRFYDEMLSDEVFSVFFSGPEAIHSLVEQQKKNFIESLQDDHDAFEERFKQIGLIHYRIKIPYIDFVKGTSILKESVVESAANGAHHNELIGLIYEYFRLSLSFMAKGYLDAMIETDKRDIEHLIQQYSSVKGDEHKLTLAQLQWLLHVLQAVEQGDYKGGEKLQTENLEIHRQFQALIDQGVAGKSEFVNKEHLEVLHERLLRDTQSLFYFLSRSSYTDVLPIYTGLLSVYKISLFLVSNLMISTRLEEAQNELKKVEDRYRQLVENSTDAIFLTTADGNVQFANPAVQEMFGYSPDEFISEPDLLERIIHPDHRKKLIGQLEYVAGEQPFAKRQVELAWFHKDGREICTENTTTANIDKQGNLIGIQTISRDITERKRTSIEMELARKEAERASLAKSTFLANMSHELRTPLNAILGFSAMLERDPDTTSAQQDKINIINRSGKHLLSMINDVLDLSKIEAGRIELEEEALNLPVMLQEIAHMFEGQAESAGLHFNLKVSSDLAQYIKIDTGKLRQILINLLGNAVKFTQSGGIYLYAKTLPVNNDPSRNTLQLEIKDSGIGIAKEQLSRIFEPFVEAGHSASNVKGTGLGLAITKSYSELMGGGITVESELGKGSLFRVELPVELIGAVETADAPASRLTVLGLETGQPKWRILVVEDNLENRLLLVSLLKQVGFDVQEVENGEEAVRTFSQWHPHFIWMDIRMPVMSGFEATARIRKMDQGDEVKIVALTASVFQEQREKILEAGCDEVLRKPYQAHEIFDYMQRLLGVTYLYERDDATMKVSSTRLSSDQIKELTPGLRSKLLEAAQGLDDRAIIEISEQMWEISPDLSMALREIAANYDFELLVDSLNSE